LYGWEAVRTRAARHDSVGRVIRAGVVTTLLLFVLQSVAGLVASLHFRSYNSGFDLNRNNAIPDVLSTAAILAAALGAIALAARVTRDRWQARALAILLAVVALDDLLQKEAGDANAWNVSVIITLALTTFLILAIATRVPRRAGVTLLIGLCLLVAAVKNAGLAPYDDRLLIALTHSDEQRGDLGYELDIVLKQGLELFGWSLVAIGIWATAVAARVECRRTSGSTSVAPGSSSLAQSLDP
jgi:cell division protein FtsW (lipid II flippase)